MQESTLKNLQPRNQIKDGCRVWIYQTSTVETWFVRSMKWNKKIKVVLSKRQSHKCLEEVREPFVRQGCLMLPWSPQITLHPCFYFSPSCNKSAPTWDFLFLPPLQPVLFQPKCWDPSGSSRALCCVDFLPRHGHAPFCCCSLLPSARRFLVLAPCKTFALSWGHHNMSPSTATSYTICLSVIPS